VLQVTYPVNGAIEYFNDSKGRPYYLNLKEVYKKYGISPSFFERMFGDNN
jgi:hypothetical protein